MQNSETRADGPSSAVPAPKRRRLYRALVELPPRLLGTIVPEPAPGWMPRPAWNAPLTIARLPTLIAGGDFIAGELTTRGTVPAVETWIFDHDAVVDHQGARLADHARRCLADATPIAGLGGHLVDDGHEQPRLEICVYRYGQLPEGLQAIIDERGAGHRRRRRHARENPTNLSTVKWASDWFLADGTCITDLLPADCRSRALPSILTGTQLRAAPSAVTRSKPSTQRAHQTFIESRPPGAQNCTSASAVSGDDAVGDLCG